MIKTIKLKHCATYSSGTLVKNCPKVNFFYGPTGSGKTTISNFLDRQKDELYRNCEIEWKKDSTVDVIVYN